MFVENHFILYACIVILNKLVLDCLLLIFDFFFFPSPAMQRRYNLKIDSERFRFFRHLTFKRVLASNFARFDSHFAMLYQTSTDPG